MGALCSKRAAPSAPLRTEPKKRNEYQELNKQNPDADAQVITFVNEQGEPKFKEDPGAPTPPPPTPTPTPTHAPKFFDEPADPTPVDEPADPTHKPKFKEDPRTPTRKAPDLKEGDTPAHKPRLAARAEEIEGEDQKEQEKEKEREKEKEQRIPYELAIKAYMLFRKMDKNNSGDIDLEEVFTSYLEGKKGGGGLTQEDAKFIGLEDTKNKDDWISSVDKDGDRKITFREFLAFLCKRKAPDLKEGDTPTDKPQLAARAEEIEGEDQRIPYELAIQAYMLFRKMDKNNSGDIDLEEVFESYFDGMKGGGGLTQEDAKFIGLLDTPNKDHWISSVDKDGDRKITFHEFLELLCKRKAPDLKEGDTHQEFL